MNTIENVNFKGKRVLVRVDFNVPKDKDGNISDDTRIREALPTINKLINDGAKVILMAHFGRPKKGGFEEEFSLKPVAQYLSNLLNKEVVFTQELLGDKVYDLADNLKDGDVMLLENIRFYPGETKGDEHLAKQLAQLGDAYVNDAFGAAHRKHSSTAVIAKFFPHAKYFGLLMQQEVENLNKLLGDVERPFTAIIGGSKVSSKMDILLSLCDKVDYLLIGGGMRYTFAKGNGHKIGESICEDDKMEAASKVIYTAKAKGVNIDLTHDNIIADSFSNDAKIKYIPDMEVPDGWMAMDIGEKTIAMYEAIIRKSKTILWNGPMGVFEFPNFAKGTQAIAKAVADATVNNGAFSAVGGGDSVAAIKQAGYADKVSYISTGGGAMLEFIEGKTLPGIAAIEEIETSQPKRVLITGATSGIGKACAEKFAEKGCDVIITGRRKERLDTLKEDLEKTYGVNVMALNFDVRDNKAVEENLNSLPVKWRKIDVLVNNAGLAAGKDPVQSASLDDWEQMVDTDVKGLLYVSRIVLPWMCERKKGHVINLCSIAGKEVYAGGSVYCAVKHAVDAISKGMRIDCLPYNIKVTNICPGAVETEFSMVRFKGDMAKNHATYEGFTPLTGEDVADTIVYTAFLPQHVCINDLVIMPTAQANSGLFFRQ
ncbi:MAG: phosphoglycerate kinase [Bacteroidales bacterium]|nr:phosphoglycerate kinase [Bacteroidales bacterium]